MKIIFKVLFIFALALSAVSIYADRLMFTEFGASYGNIIDPAAMSDNTSGVYDTAVIEAKAGVEIFKWAGVYAGAAFHYFFDRLNWQNHYSFYPVFGGIRANIFPEWCVYPSLSAELGIAFANRHTDSGSVSDDRPWTASYYNFGIAANWKISDVTTLIFSIERPSVSTVEESEIHIFKTGLAWKILY